AFGSDDKVGVNINGNFAEQDPVLGGNFNFEDGYAGQGINFHDITGAKDGFWNTLYHFHTFLDESFGGGLYLDTTLEDFGDWFTWKHDFDPDNQLEAGLQADVLINGTQGYFVVFPTEFNDPTFTATTANKINADDSLSSVDAAAYFDQKFKWFGGKLQFSAGARLDYLTTDSRAVLAPRFSAAYLLSGQTTLKASYGYYNEAPSRIEGSTYLDPSLGNPRLGPEQSISTILGVEQKLEKGLDLRVEGYEKDFSQLIVGDEALNYSNEGTGRAQGVEFFLRREPTERFFGWISYSLSRSQRQDGPGLPTYTYDFDEPNILTVVANYKFNPGWDAGFKWLYSSGLPYTPVVLGDASPVTTTLNNSPVTYYVPNSEPVNSRRLPDYVRLDVSTSFSTVYDTWEWRVYFDIINVLHNQDVLGYQYNSDYTQQSAVLDLPFLPYVGFEAKY
ncbi:MAG TPA: TonB-dependent receptor, partial [bacterium]|nr:TonB-dependent receptor [bacterium]